MIIQEIINETLVKTYSDRGVMIHGGFPEADYAEVIDPISMHRTYVETDIPIPVDATDEDYAAAGRILMGVQDGNN